MKCYKIVLCTPKIFNFPKILDYFEPKSTSMFLKLEYY